MMQRAYVLNENTNYASVKVDEAEKALSDAEAEYRAIQDQLKEVLRELRAEVGESYVTWKGKVYRIFDNELVELKTVAVEDK